MGTFSGGLASIAWSEYCLPVHITFYCEMSSISCFLACILDKSNQSSSPSPPSDTTVPLTVGVAVGVVLVVVVVVVVVVVCCRRRINNRKQLESSRAFSYVVNLLACLFAVLQELTKMWAPCPT